ncbi:MAG: rhomboid family intramembrane serine protease [Planctomycetes bacterium]|nr:rhomboid family intramembrane serine protease [Planctomycetota bacterium]
MFPIKTTERLNSWPIVTWLLIAANIYGFVQTLYVKDPDAFMQMWALVPANYDLRNPGLIQWTQYTILPIFTHMFLHGGIAHIAGNLLSLLVFGPNVEDRFGKIGFLIFYFACGLAAAVTQVAFSQGSTIPTLGASGAIAGVMGAFFVLYPTAKVVSVVPIIVYPLIVRVPAWVYLFFFAGMNVVNALKEMRMMQDSQGVAWWAHIGGFAIGMVYGLILGRRKAEPKASAGETHA